MSSSDEYRDRLSQRLKENPVIVEDTDEGFCIKMESDIYEGLNQIAIEDYGYTIEMLLYKFFEWPMTDPDGFIKWAKEAMMKDAERRLVEEVKAAEESVDDGECVTLPELKQSLGLL